MTTVNDIDDADVAWAYGGSGWTAQSGQSTTLYGAGTYHSGGTANATATVTASGRAFYLLTQLSSGGGSFTLQIDGSPAGTFSGYGWTTMNGFVLPLASGLAEGAHTLVLTLGGDGTVLIDALLAVTGTRPAAQQGVYVALGDSITAGEGAARASLGGYAGRTTALLQTALGRPITLQNKGVAGDYWFAQTTRGGLYRLISDVLPQQPEFLSLLFGANDLIINAGTSLGDYVRCALSALRLVGDLLDVASTTVALGTVPYANCSYVNVPVVGPSVPQIGWMAAYDEAATLVRHAAAAFGWCRIANVFDAVDYHDMWADTTRSPHLNDSGHAVVAMEFVRAFLGAAV